MSNVSPSPPLPQPREIGVHKLGVAGPIERPKVSPLGDVVLPLAAALDVTPVLLRPAEPVREPARFTAELVHRLHAATKLRGPPTARVSAFASGVTACLSGASAALGTVLNHGTSSSAVFTAWCFGMIGLLGGSLLGHAAVSVVGSLRPLRASDLAFLEQAHSSGSLQEKAIVSALARDWRQRLDARNVTGVEARQLLSRLAQSSAEQDEQGEAVSAYAAKIVSAASALYAAAAESDYVKTEDSGALVTCLENLSEPERATLASTFWPWLFTANGRARVRFSETADAHRIAELLKVA